MNQPPPNGSRLVVKGTLAACIDADSALYVTIRLSSEQDTGNPDGRDAVAFFPFVCEDESAAPQVQSVAVAIGKYVTQADQSLSRRTATAGQQPRSRIQRGGRRMTKATTTTRCDSRGQLCHRANVHCGFRRVWPFVSLRPNAPRATSSRQSPSFLGPMNDSTCYLIRTLTVHSTARVSFYDAMRTW